MSARFPAIASKVAEARIGLMIGMKVYICAGMSRTHYESRQIFQIDRAIIFIGPKFNQGTSSMYAQPFGSGSEDKFSGHKDDPESSMLHLQVAFSALIPWEIHRLCR